MANFYQHEEYKKRKVTKPPINQEINYKYSVFRLIFALAQSESHFQERTIDKNQSMHPGYGSAPLHTCTYEYLDDASLYSSFRSSTSKVKVAFGGIVQYC